MKFHLIEHNGKPRADWNAKVFAYSVQDLVLEAVDPEPYSSSTLEAKVDKLTSMLAKLMKYTCSAEQIIEMVKNDLYCMDVELIKDK